MLLSLDMARWVVVALVLLSCSVSRAQPLPRVRLRMAAIAPDGTGWAREFKALSRDLSALTGDTLELKWYLGGIAGDELEAVERVRRGQLDGTAGALFCERLAPSLRVTRITGLFQNRDETRYVIGRMRTKLDAEFENSGFVNLGVAGFGNDIFFSRMPVRSLAELRQGRYWIWSADELWRELLKELGVKTIPLPIVEASKAYDENRIDGFIAVPTGALAFQWSTRARYYSEMRAGFLPGCFVVAKRAWDKLSVAHQQAMRTATAKFVIRFEDLGRTMDEALLGGLFEKQGLIKVPVSDSFRAEFFDAARRAREKLSNRLVSEELLSQVLVWLADFRAEHPQH
jgi:TRAP-type C4-dicarboxylate transport system substrate-binding protein